MAKLKTDPCWKCTERHEACHDSCEKYKAVVEQQKRAKEKLWIDNEVSKYMEHSMRRN